jgi:exopolyphosphatase/guanosine-5'-triphosphate,3'-diphosphate pyrophosphatase
MTVADQANKSDGHRPPLHFINVKTLRDETLGLRDRFDDEPVHSDHVTALSLQIFDALQEWHRLDSRSRDLLECAATLHDIGWSQTVEGRGHHKRSAQLIHEQDWRHLVPGEVAVVAQVARYHRRSIPQPGHEAFHELLADDQRKVLVLGGILRIADALDRSHIQKVTRVEAEIGGEALTIRVRAKGGWDEEKRIFEKKRDMLELAAGRAVRCAAF